MFFVALDLGQLFRLRCCAVDGILDMNNWWLTYMAAWVSLIFMTNFTNLTTFMSAFHKVSTKLPGYHRYVITLMPKRQKDMRCPERLPKMRFIAVCYSGQEHKIGRTHLVLNTRPLTSVIHYSIHDVHDDQATTTQNHKLAKTLSQQIFLSRWPHAYLNKIIHRWLLGISKYYISCQ